MVLIKTKSKIGLIEKSFGDEVFNLPWLYVPWEIGSYFCTPSSNLHLGKLSLP